MPEIQNALLLAWHLLLTYGIDDSDHEPTIKAMAEIRRVVTKIQEGK